MTGILVRRDETEFPGGPVAETSPLPVKGTWVTPGQGRLHVLRSHSAYAPQLLQLVLCSATRGGQ